ncbi:MAG: DUF1616 domain-containing protein, partial [Methanothrix sp.]|nr:DUF1616 domain-containing protein [Methanothrix sp.]
MHLTASVLISILVLVLVHLSPGQVHGFSVPLGLILVIFIPGYLLVLAIFPAGSDLTGKRRTLLSLGFDAILTVLVCLILVLTPRGLQPASLATILSLLSLFLFAVAHARWSALPRRRRFVILSNRGFRTYKPLARTTRGNGKRSAVYFALLLMAIFAIAAFAYAINTYHGAQDDTGFTEFHVSLLKENDDASLKAGSPVTAQAQIINHENRAINYTLWLVLNGSTVLRKNLTLSRNEIWKGPVSFILNGQASGNRLDFLLFKDYDFSAPSKEDHLWINLSENKSTQNTTSDQNSPVTDEQRGKVSVLSASNGSSQVDYQPSGGGSVSASTGSSSRSSSKMKQESRTIQENSAMQSSSQEEEAQGQSSPSSPDEVLNSTTESLKDDKTTNGSNASKAPLSFAKSDLENQTASSAANISYPIEEEIESLSSNLPPDLADFYPDVQSPQIEGTTVLWTAEASDPEGDMVFYRFFLNGRGMTDWSTDSSWTWNTSQASPGDYKISVQARDGKHASEDSFDDSMDVSFTLMAPNQKPVLQELKPDVPSPQESGMRVAWKAVAEDSEGDPIFYRFFLNGRGMTDWSTDSSWTWNTTQASPGDYKIGVLARDGKHASEDSFDDSMNATFSLLAQNQPPALLN